MTASQPNTDLTSRNRRRFKTYALATAGAAALTLMAQSAVAQDAAKADSIEQVTVTGTRVVRDGYNAPTPVTVIGTDAIQATAPANLADFVEQLPSVVGSTTASTGSGSLSNGLAGVNALNLRSLGARRTLILLDGHRTPPSATTGEIDINTIPQQLVKRVDVVTGGASADYGSDAVGGVVNFILDKDYSGLKGDLEYGQTSDSLQPNYKAGLTFGTAFDGGRGHFLVSGEWVNQAGIHNYIPNWNKAGYFKIQNPTYTTSNGQPYYYIQGGIGPSQVAPGGLIVSGPLQGTYFGQNAAVNHLAYGQVSGPWMVGGDTNATFDNYLGTSSLAAGEVRESLFTRAAYSITPDIEVYGEASVTRYKGISYYTQPPSVGGITILADNAYVPTSVKTALAAAGQTSFTEGSTNSGFPMSGSRNGREVQRLSGGADGTFNLLTDWKWDLHAQIGVSNTREQETPVWNNARLALAQDAVAAPAGNAAGIAAGTIVCRSTLTVPGNGCVPISRVGVNGGLQDPAAFQAGLNYVLGNPYRLQRLSEQSYSFNVTGNPFENWQGPVSLAFGGEWRIEAVNGFVPTQYQSGWLFGNYLVNHGHYSVAETYLETVVPLAPGLDFNGSARYTAYSTSGGTSTWKTGLTYAPPFLPDIKLRATYSHDIRAPNLDELFSTGTARTNTVNVNNTSLTFVQNLRGNPNVSPEGANTLGLGIVFSPTFIDGLTASVDYYDITISKAIGTITAQNTADLCYIQGIQSYCNNITYVGGASASTTNAGVSISSILLVPFNFAKQKSSGIDFDVTYNVPLDAFEGILGNIPGDLTLHGLATHYIRNYTNDGVNPPADIAGVNVGSGTPSWLYHFTATYHTDPWTFFMQGRGVTPGQYVSEYITCTTGCPTASVYNRTTNNNSIGGAFYVDATITYAFDMRGLDTDVFFSVKNLFDTDPPLVAQGPDGNQWPAYPQTNRLLYDSLGRVMRVGVRFKM